MCLSILTCVTALTCLQCLNCFVTYCTNVYITSVICLTHLAYRLTHKNCFTSLSSLASLLILFSGFNMKIVKANWVPACPCVLGLHTGLQTSPLMKSVTERTPIPKESLIDKTSLCQS